MREALSRSSGTGGAAIDEFTANHVAIAKMKDDGIGADLGWMEPTPYLALGRRAMLERVVRPLQARGIDPYAPDAAPVPSASASAKKPV